MALHQKQDKHHDWLKRQMQSLLVDVNRIRNLATNNAFVSHEACWRSWKSLTLLSSEDDLREDGFTERYKFDSTPPRNAVLRRTPSLEDNTLILTISHTFIPVENFNQFVINHQKGGDCKCI